jgi:hypothetical protein
MDDVPKGGPLAIDATAQSASPTEPAFIARPEGAPVYYGFVVLDDVTVDGFTLGKITDFEAEPCDEGDAFVIAPDGSRASDPVSQEVGSSLQLGSYEPDDQPIRRPITRIRYSHACRSEVRQGLPDTSEYFSSAGRIPDCAHLWKGKRVGQECACGWRMRA